jgi:hypothetical protein
MSLTGSYEEMIEKDLELIWSILNFVRSHEWLDDFMARIVSKHPWQVAEMLYGSEMMG